MYDSSHIKTKAKYYLGNTQQLLSFNIKVSSIVNGNVNGNERTTCSQCHI